MKEKTYSSSIAVADFLDHRKFLEAVVEDLRMQKVFSHRTFNRECGFGSPNFVQLVIQGKRNLSPEAATRIAQALGLNKNSMRLFLKMREMNLETDPSIRLALMQNLLQQPGFVERHEVSQTELSFYSRWYNVIVRELLQSHPMLSAEEIGRALQPPVKAEDIARSLEQMQALGFITKEATGWVVVHRQINTRNEILYHALSAFHSTMIELARESLQRFKGHEREVSSITLQLTKNEFLELREKIREFKREALAHEKTEGDAQVYQFNFQLFPVTRIIQEPES